MDEINIPTPKRVLKETFNFKFFSPLRTIEASEGPNRESTNMSEMADIKHIKKKKKKSKQPAAENLAPVAQVMSPVEEVPRDQSGSGKKKKKSKHSIEKFDIVNAADPVAPIEPPVVSDTSKKNKLKLTKKMGKPTNESDGFDSADTPASPKVTGSVSLTSPPSKKRKSADISPGAGGDGPSSNKKKRSRKSENATAVSSIGDGPQAAVMTPVMVKQSPSSKSPTKGKKAATKEVKPLVQPVISNVSPLTSDSSSDSSSSDDSDEEAEQKSVPQPGSSQKPEAVNSATKTSASTDAHKFKTADIIARIAADIKRDRSSASGSDTPMSPPANVPQKAALPASPLVGASPTKRDRSKLSLKSKSPTKAMPKIAPFKDVSPKKTSVTPASLSGPTKQAAVHPKPAAHAMSSASDTSSDESDSEDEVENKNTPATQMSPNKSRQPSKGSSDSDIFKDSADESVMKQNIPTVEDTSSDSDSSDADLPDVQPVVPLTGSVRPVESSSESESSDEEENPLPVPLVSPGGTTSQSTTPQRTPQSKKTPSRTPSSSSKGTKKSTATTSPQINNTSAPPLRYEHPGFKERTNTEHSPLCIEDVQGKALWLVSLPPNFDPARLDGKPIIMNGTLQMEKDADESANWELLSSKLVPNIPGLTALLPSRLDGQLHSAGIVESHISIVKTVMTPPSLVPTQTKQPPAFPDSLKHRNTPFGSGNPFISDSPDFVKKVKKEKKKKKKRETENAVSEISNIAETPEPDVKKVKKEKKKKHRDSETAALDEPAIAQPMEVDSPVSEAQAAGDSSLKKVKKEKKKKRKSETTEQLEPEPIPSEELPEESEGAMKKKKKKKKKHKEHD